MPCYCAVSGCKSVFSKKGNLLFHKFPKDEELQCKWISLCKRKDHINPATARICSRHFKQEMYERNLKYEILQLPLPHRQIRMKPGALPTLHLPINESIPELMPPELMDVKIRELNGLLSISDPKEDPDLKKDDKSEDQEHQEIKEPEEAIEVKIEIKDEEIQVKEEVKEKYEENEKESSEEDEKKTSMNNDSSANERKDVMKRWTNVRDCYAKFNKRTKEAKKSGAGACKVKSYIYSKELEFLSKLYEERDTQDSFDGPGTCEEEHDGGASSDPLPSQKSSSGASDVGRKRSRKLDPFEEQMLKIMDDDAKNRHMSFFRSVLPSLEKFDDDEVLKFQMDVLQSISKIKEGKLRKTTTHNVHMFSPSGGSPYPTFWQHQSYPPHTSLPPPATHHHSQTSRFPNAAQPGHVSGDFQGYEQQMSSSYADNAVSPTPTQFSNDSIDFTS